jgi:hypothetical protein
VERSRERDDAAWLKVKAPQFFRLVGCGASSGINIIASRSVKNCLRSTRDPFSVSWPFLNRSDRGFAVVFNINKEDLLLIECRDNDILRQTRNEVTILGKVDQLRLSELLDVRGVSNRNICISTHDSISAPCSH